MFHIDNPFITRHNITGSSCRWTWPFGNKACFENTLNQTIPFGDTDAGLAHFKYHQITSVPVYRNTIYTKPYLTVQSHYLLISAGENFELYIDKDHFCRTSITRDVVDWKCTYNLLRLLWGWPLNLCLFVAASGIENLFCVPVSG